MIPPPYPRIPHLLGHPAKDANDKVLPSLRASAVLRSHRLIVEEKLDGFNVAIVRDSSGWPVPHARSGKTHGDRGNQLGRARTFVNEVASALNAVLDSWPVLYAEWLMREHSIAYDSLPSWLVVLDCWSPTTGFAGVEQRNLACASVGLVTPPWLFTGVVGSIGRIEALTRKSHFAQGPAEGVVLREEAYQEKGPIAKWLSPGFRRKSDDELSKLKLNKLCTSGTSS